MEKNITIYYYICSYKSTVDRSDNWSKYKR